MPSFRILHFTPTANRSGTATITVTVRDDQNSIVTRSFMITVNEVNDVPTLADIANVTMQEDGEREIELEASAGAGEDRQSGGGRLGP